MRPRNALLILVCLLAGCAASPVRDEAPTSIVKRYLDALNRRDMLVLTAYVAPDVQWYSVTKGEALLEASGRDELVRLLEQYFKRYPHTRWTLDTTMFVDGKLAVAERSEWGERSPYEARVTVGVYEFETQRIKRITYLLD